ncbi:5621_t:CDS:2, partial [Gigaspora margarita]
PKRRRVIHANKKALEPDLFVSRHYLGEMNAICVNCKALMWIDERISTSSRTNPKFSLCCSNNRVQLPPLIDPPEPLYTLLFGSDLRSKHFQEMIRAYNTALSFASMGAQIDEQVTGTKGIYAFRIHGEIYHNIGSLLPHDNNARPQFAQLYFYDTHNELQNRLHIMPELDPIILKELQSMLHRINPYAATIKQIHETWITNPVLPLSMIIKSTRTNDPRRYNIPTANEIAIVIIDNEEENDILTTDI